MTPPKKILTPEQIQANVDEVMRQSATHRNFDTLLAALMYANDRMEPGEMVRKLTGAGVVYGTSTIVALRKGYRPPTYNFLEDLLASNVLHVRPVVVDDKVIDPREVFFDKAHLTPVTAESIDALNHRVMKRVEADLANDERLHWVDIMKELLAFHMQGERMTMDKIQEVAKAFLPTDTKPDSKDFKVKRRLTNIMQKDTRATAAERHAVYKFLRLPDQFIELLETELQKPNAKITDNLRPVELTDFSRKLDELLIRLKDAKDEHQMDAKQVELRSHAQASLKGLTYVTSSDLSDWRKGQKVPTLTKVRALLRVFEAISRKPKSIIHKEDVQELMLAAPYKPEEITHTAHNYIREANENTTDIHELLKAIRNASDIGITMDGICAVIPPGSKRSITYAHMREFENAPDNFPVPEMLEELMLRYNHVLQQGGNTPLPDEDVQKVMRICSNNKTYWNGLPVEVQEGCRTSGSWATRINSRNMDDLAKGSSRDNSAG